MMPWQLLQNALELASYLYRRFYWFEVLDENNSLLLDTDGVGNALASILEDSKLQVVYLTVRACRTCCFAPINAYGC